MFMTQPLLAAKLSAGDNEDWVGGDSAGDSDDGEEGWVGNGGEDQRRQQQRGWCRCVALLVGEYDGLSQRWAVALVLVVALSHCFGAIGTVALLELTIALLPAASFLHVCVCVCVCA